MLNIINNLKPFFEDCYRRISVREYSRLIKVSPPTASQLLSKYKKEGLLQSEKDCNYLYYFPHETNSTFIDLSRIYWKNKLAEVTEHLNKYLLDPTIILFGSLAKAESKLDSDIDLCIIGHKKEIDFSPFEKKLKRNIQTFFFTSISQIENKELANNIVNGYILKGRIKL